MRGISKSWTCLLLRAILPAMSDTARDYQTIDSASLNGLDDIFVGSELGSDHKGLKELGSEPFDSRAVEVVSTEEAARRLGISTRAVIKRLKTGSMKGFRDQSKPRAEWRIYWTEPGSEPSLIGTFAGTVGGTSEPIDSSGTASGLPVTDNGSDYLIEMNKKLLEQLQALVYRNGYLESQLSEREKDIVELDQQMKLLTDSQHKGGWWANFSSWFFKGK